MARRNHPAARTVQLRLSHLLSRSFPELLIQLDHHIPSTKVSIGRLFRCDWDWKVAFYSGQSGQLLRPYLLEVAEEQNEQEFHAKTRYD